MVPFKTTNLNVSAAVTVGTTLSAQGIIYAQGGNSNLWNQAYTNVQSNSSSYVLQGGNTTTVPLSVGTNSAQPLILETGGVARVTILSSGQVNIGTNQSLSATAPVILQQTWNNSGNAFTLLSANVINNASASTSKLADFQVNGTSVLEVDGRGLTKVRKVSNTTDFINIFEVFRGSTSLFQFRDDGNYTFTATQGGALATLATVAKSSGLFLASGGQLGWTSSATDGYNVNPDLSLFRDAANTLAQRNGLNAQTFRLYNNFTTGTPVSSEFAYIGWTGNTLQLGTSATGSGSNRDIVLQTVGTTRMSVTSAGNIGIGTTTPNERLTVSGSISATGSASISSLNISVPTRNTNIITLRDQIGNADATFYFTNPIGSPADLNINAGRVIFPNYAIRVNRIEGTGGNNIDLTTSNMDLVPNGNGRLSTGSSGQASYLRFGKITSYISNAFDTSLYAALVLQGSKRFAAWQLEDGTIKGTIENDGAIRLFNSSSEFGYTQWSGNTFQIGTSSTGGGQNRDIVFQTVGTTRMSVTSAGNIGIGTTTPNERLTVVGTVSTSSHGDSSQWNSAYTTVQANSASWATDSTTDTGVRALTGNWQSTYTTVQANSASWATDSTTDVGVRALTGNWQGTYTTVQSNSANWNNAYNTGTIYQTNSASYATNTLLQTTSALLTPVTTTRTLTGLLVTNTVFDSYKTNVASATATLLPTSIYQNASGNWQSTYTTVQANSASWATDSTTDTGVRALTSNWQGTYTTVQANSATNWNYQGTDLKALSSNWQSAYNTVQSNSASWEESADITAITTVVASNSGNWNNAYNTGTVYQTNSATYATNTTVNSISSLLTPLTLTRTLTGQLVTNTDFNNYRTDVATATATLLPTTIYRAASGNWQETYTTVQSNSATWGAGGGGGIDTGVRALTSNWQGTYTTVQNNSASWGTGGGVNEEFVIAMSIGLS